MYTGLRPGEKLFEELFIPGESYVRTAHQKIFVAHHGAANPACCQGLDEKVDRMIAAAERGDRTAIVQAMQALVPEYRPGGAGFLERLRGGEGERNRRGRGMAKIESVRELEVYKMAFEAAMRIFHVTKAFPAEERFSLIDQIRRAPRSVCTNLSEGWRKRRYKGFLFNKLSDAMQEAFGNPNLARVLAGLRLH